MGYNRRHWTKMGDDVTQILQRISEGDSRAADELLPLVYDELRRLAAAYFVREKSGHTLQPTALVHEAYLRLIGQTRVEWQNRAHFFAVAANMMRRILVDHARSKAAEKHGGDRTRIEVEKAISFASEERAVDLIAVDESLEILASLDEVQSRIVELRFFGGLTIEETAEVMNISPATVKREWSMAKAWLYDRLSSE
jgi:RNA polymerase sigma factor (TIGR02999 family)